MSENPSIPELSVVILCYHSADVVRTLVAQVERELEEARIDYIARAPAALGPGGKEVPVCRG